MSEQLSSQKAELDLRERGETVLCCILKDPALHHAGVTLATVIILGILLGTEL